MAIEASDLIVIAFLSGIGSGFGTLIGQSLYRKFVEHPLKQLTNLDTSSLRKEYSNSLRLLDAIDVAKKKVKNARDELEVQGGNIE
jgi:hypothetical protein